MHIPLLLPILLVLLALARASGQSTDGFTRQETPGIAMVKPQAWAKENEATVLEFEALTNRTTDGAQGSAGYYEFVTKGGARRQIPTSRVVEILVYPDPAQIKNVATIEDRKQLAALIDKIKALVGRFPAAKTYVGSSLKAVEAEVARFDEGQVKADGKWVPKAAYVKDKAARLAALLAADIDQAKPPSSFDLAADPKYVSLEQLAAASPEAKTILADVTARHGKLVRTEKRGELLRTLSNPNASLSECERALTQLKSLKPEEDPKSVAVIQSWDTGLKAVQENQEVGAELAGALEAELKEKPENAIPDIPQSLDAKIAKLGGNVRVFLREKPAPQLVSASRQAIAVCEVASAFGKLRKVFADRRFFEAKDVLDKLAGMAGSVGPNSSRVVSGLQRETTVQIEQFTRLREEAKLLMDSGKNREALGKYQAAFAVIPDASIQEQIKQLEEIVQPPASPQ